MPAPRPYVVLSCAMSADGYIDDATKKRLLLSNEADFDRVDAERAASDAILVGANTIRRDDPRLLVRSERRRTERLRRGLPSSPAKVTVTASGAVDRDRKFFTEGNADVARLVYSGAGAAGLRARLEDLPGVEVIPAVPAAGRFHGPGTVTVPLAQVLANLGGRGIGRLLVEGGTSILTQFLADGLADELHLVVAPFFVGGGARLVGEASFPFDANHRMTLAETRPIGDVVLLRYLLPAEEPARVSAA